MLLLKNAADINSQTNGGQTPLHLAAISVDNARLLEMLLLNITIDVKIKNSIGETAFDIALRNGPHHKLFEMADDSISTSSLENKSVKLSSETP